MRLQLPNGANAWRHELKLPPGQKTFVRKDTYKDFHQINQLREHLLVLASQMLELSMGGYMIEYGVRHSRLLQQAKNE